MKSLLELGRMNERFRGKSHPHFGFRMTKKINKLNEELNESYETTEQLKTEIEQNYRSSSSHLTIAMAMSKMSKSLGTLLRNSFSSMTLRLGSASKVDAPTTPENQPIQTRPKRPQHPYARFAVRFCSVLCYLLLLGATTRWASRRGD